MKANLTILFTFFLLNLLSCKQQNLNEKNNYDFKNKIARFDAPGLYLNNSGEKTEVDWDSATSYTEVHVKNNQLEFYEFSDTSNDRDIYGGELTRTIKFKRKLVDECLLDINTNGCLVLVNNAEVRSMSLTVRAEDVIIRNLPQRSSCYINTTDCDFYSNGLLSTRLSGYSQNAIIRDCVIKDLDFDIIADSLIVRRSNIDSTSYLLLGNTTIIKDIIGYGTLNLIKQLPSQNVNLILSNVDLDRITIPGDDFSIKVIIDTTQSYLSQVRLYKQLINRYNDFPDAKKRYDIQLRKLVNQKEKNYITDFIEENWNNYGYDKYLIFRNSMILMAIVFLINLIFYKKLINKVYIIESLKEEESKWVSSRNNLLIRSAYYSLHCFIYTSFVFWGLKLDIEKLKFKMLLGSFWIFIQYMIGIVCLAYIANIILTK